MEEKKEASGAPTGHGQGCMCPGCAMRSMHPMWGYHRFMVLRLLLGIVILVIIFLVGVKVGEFKGIYSDANWNENPHTMIMQRRAMPVNFEQGGMAGENIQYQVIPSQSIPAPSTRTTTGTK